MTIREAERMFKNEAPEKDKTLPDTFKELTITHK